MPNFNDPDQRGESFLFDPGRGRRHAYRRAYEANPGFDNANEPHVVPLSESYGRPTPRPVASLDSDEGASDFLSTLEGVNEAAIQGGSFSPELQGMMRSAAANPTHIPPGGHTDFMTDRYEDGTPGMGDEYPPDARDPHDKRPFVQSRRRTSQYSAQVEKMSLEEAKAYLEGDGFHRCEYGHDDANYDGGPCGNEVTSYVTGLGGKDPMEKHVWEDGVPMPGMGFVTDQEDLTWGSRQDSSRTRAYGKDPHEGWKCPGCGGTKFNDSGGDPLCEGCGQEWPRDRIVPKKAAWQPGQINVFPPDDYYADSSQWYVGFVVWDLDPDYPGDNHDVAESLRQAGLIPPGAQLDPESSQFYGYFNTEEEARRFASEADRYIRSGKARGDWHRRQQLHASRKSGPKDMIVAAQKMLDAADQARKSGDMGRVQALESRANRLIAMIERFGKVTGFKYGDAVEKDGRKGIVVRADEGRPVIVQWMGGGKGEESPDSLRPTTLADDEADMLSRMTGHRKQAIRCRGRGCNSQDTFERYSLGITAGYWCDDCWDKSGYRKEGPEGFDPGYAGESYDEDPVVGRRAGRTMGVQDSGLDVPLDDDDVNTGFAEYDR